MTVPGYYRSICKSACVAIPVFLASCSTFSLPSLPSLTSEELKVAPALQVLALDFERTNFTKESRVSGRVAKDQRDLMLSTPTAGRLRKEALGMIPTEVRVTVDRLSTSGNRVNMSGTLELRDLALGTIMARLDDFTASGPMPVIPASASVQGLVFRGVEDEVIDWLSGLECDTAARRCGIPAEPMEDEIVPVTETGDIELAALVGPRPVGLQKINTGGIDPERVIAAAAPVEPARERTDAEMLVGRTVAALGLLDRSGFWLQTPLVQEEGTGFVVNPANGKRIAVTLVPKDGPVGGGSQMSLAAMSELGAAMTDLINIEVYR